MLTGASSQLLRMAIQLWRRSYGGDGNQHGEAAFERQRAGNPVRIADPERPEQLSNIEIRRPDRIDHRQSDGDRPAGIDAKEVFVGDPRFRLRAELESAPPQ